MITFLTVVYVIVCIFLILVVLLQAGRGGGMGAAFGGSSQTVFGGAGAGNFLTRLTVIMAALFMLLSATLAYLSSSSDKGLEEAVRARQVREEARKLDPKDKTAAGAAGGAASEPAPASTPEGEPGVIEVEQVDGLPEGMQAAEPADPAGAPPAEPGAEPQAAPAAEPVPAAPAEPVEPAAPAPQ